MTGRNKPNGSNTDVIDDITTGVRNLRAIIAIPDAVEARRENYLPWRSKFG